MNNVTLRAVDVTRLYGGPRADSQQTGILGGHTAPQMRVRGIPLARQRDEDSGAIAGTVRQVAAEADARPAQLALAWVQPRPDGSELLLVPVPGTRHPGRWRPTGPRSACALDSDHYAPECRLTG